MSHVNYPSGDGQARSLVRATQGQFASRQRLTSRLITGALSLVMVLLLALSPALVEAQREGDRPGVPVIVEPGARGPVVVLVQDNADPAVVAADNEISADRVFTNVVRAFSANLTEAQVERLAQDADVVSIANDAPVSIAAESVPTGVKRIGATSNIGSGQSYNTGIAIVDSGIAPHPDLNIAGGVDCANAGTYSDNQGHGTHVAGIAGARDNGSGVVGVAPGARLYAVRVLDSSGDGTSSNVICGLDWIAANAGSIDVANLSLSGPGVDGPCSSHALHQAICNTVNIGIPVVVAAGNWSANVNNYIPATFPEVITVASFSDTNGLPGGGGGSCSGSDDHFSTFSNFGADIDIVAPGGCIYSTHLNGGFRTISGTSMAAPHVAGAIARLGSWGAVQGMAIAQNTARGILGGDPDGIAEPVLSLGSSSAPPPPPSATNTPTATPPKATATPVTPTATPPNATATPVTPIAVLPRATATPVTPVVLAPRTSTRDRTGTNPTPGTSGPTAVPRTRSVSPTATPSTGTSRPIINRTTRTLSRTSTPESDGNVTSEPTRAPRTTTRLLRGSSSFDQAAATPAGIALERYERVPMTRSSDSQVADVDAVEPTDDAGVVIGTVEPRPARETRTTPVATSVPVDTSADVAISAESTATPVATDVPATEVPPTEVPPTATATVVPPTEVPPTEVPPTVVPELPTETPIPVVAALPVAAISDTVQSGDVRYAIDANPDTAWYMTVPAQEPVAEAVVTESETTDETAESGDGRTSRATREEPVTQAVQAAEPEELFLELDLGYEQRIGSARWMWAESGYADAVQIQVSLDGENWVTVVWADNAPAWEGQAAELNVSARYVRFLFPNPNGDTVVGGLSEVEILPPAQ